MSIECKDLSKSFGSKILFNDLNLTFQSGMCNCLIGENGSGKTTLLRILSGLEKADFGKVVINGTCTYASSNPYMLSGTVEENILYPLTLKRQFGKFNKLLLNEIINKLELQDIKNQEAKTLSAGEKQKVSLGRAIIWEPDILLLDEPTANIDKNMIKTIENILLEYISKPNKTLVVVSHDMEQVNRLAGKIHDLNKIVKRYKETCNGLFECS